MYNPVKCLHPKFIRNKYTGEKLCVPCGKCSACQTKISTLWTNRLREESTCHTYTIFGTLTYHDDFLPRQDLHTVFSTSKTWEKSLKLSSSYIEYTHGNIPCVSSKDIQNFIKKIRQKISYYHGPFKIRYFVASEYGPSSFRPHYHYLLWFSEKSLVPHIKRYIFEAWKSKTRFKTLSEFLQRNKTRFVHGKAEQYVAGYLCKSYNLPAILTEKPFRTFHVQSSAPPIGTIRVFRDIVQKISSGTFNSVTLSRCSTLQSVSVPLWRGLENRLFPRCYGYSSISSSDRRTLYTLSLFGIDQSNWKEQRYDYSSFAERFLYQWYSDVPAVKLIRYLCSVSPYDGISHFCVDRQIFGDLHLLDSFYESDFAKFLFRLWSFSRRWLSYSFNLGISPEDYFRYIESYYDRKEYLSLVEQIKFEEWLSNNPRKDCSLSSYPFLIDSLFYENFRNLPYSTYSDYISQFGLGTLSDYDFVPEKTLCYAKKKSLADKIVYDTHKVRINKDYVASHPYCYLNYVSLLKPFKL